MVSALHNDYIAVSFAARTIMRRLLSDATTSRAATAGPVNEVTERV
jgi:hypothetical protein